MRKLIIAALLLAGSLSAQKASYTFFGKHKCNSNHVFRVSGVPKLGTTLIITIPQPAFFFGAVGFLITGTKLATPIDVSAFGRGSCGTLRVRPLAITFAPTNSQFPGEYKVRMTIPNARQLIGVQFFQQTGVLYGFPLINLSAQAGHGVIGT